MLDGQTPALRREGLGLLEQLGLAGWFDPYDAAEAGRWASFGEAEELGPPALVREEALAARAVADQGVKFRAWQKSLGPDHPDVAQSLNNLATLLEKTNRHVEAEPLRRRAAEILQKNSASTTPRHDAPE